MRISDWSSDVCSSDLIELRDSAPLIYRTILVPANITLRKLHVTLLWAMGWQGGHLHEFIINDLHYGEPDPDYPEHDLKNAQREIGSSSCRERVGQSV